MSTAGPNPTSGVPWWVPLVSTLAGGVLTILGGVVAPILTARRDRRHRLEDERRGSLIELHDQVARLMIAGNKIHHRYGAKFLETKVWGYEKPSDHWEGEHAEPLVRVQVLSDRIGDNELEKYLIMMRDECQNIIESVSFESSRESIRKLSGFFNLASHRVGDLLNGGLTSHRRGSETVEMGP